MKVILRGRHNIWRCSRMTPVAPRIVLDVSRVTMFLIMRVIFQDRSFKDTKSSVQSQFSQIQALVQSSNRSV